MPYEPRERIPVKVYNSVWELCHDHSVVDVSEQLIASMMEGHNADTSWKREALRQSWFRNAGGRTFDESRKYFMRGADERELRVAREMLNQIDLEIHGVQGDQWKPQVFGAYPIVPDYLAGDPMSMRNKELDENIQAPIRVLLDIAVPGSTPMETIARRAAAATAFVMKLSEQRPVELWVSDTGTNEKCRKDYGWRCKLDMPVNMAQVMAAFNPSVNRMLLLNMASQITAGTGKHDGAGFPFVLNGIAGGNHSERYMQELRKYNGLSEDDIVLHTILSTSDMQQIDRNPAKWVKDMLIKHGVQAEDY